MAAYIIGMQKIVSLASQRKRVAAPRGEPDGASVGYWPISRRFVEKTPGSKDFLSSSRMTGYSEAEPLYDQMGISLLLGDLVRLFGAAKGGRADG
jgi:hypothetical protein